MTPSPWTLVVAGPVRRAIGRIPPKVAAAVLDFLLGPLSQNPQRIGHLLRSELAGLHSARVGAYRIVYEIDEPTRTVTVLHLDHRTDIYRPR